MTKKIDQVTVACATANDSSSSALGHAMNSPIKEQSRVVELIARRLVTVLVSQMTKDQPKRHSAMIILNPVA